MAYLVVPVALLHGASRGQAQGMPDPSQPDFYRRYQAWVESQEDFSTNSDELFQEMEAMRREFIDRMRRNDQLLKQAKPKDTYRLQSQPGVTQIFQEDLADKTLIHIKIPELESGNYRVEVRGDRLFIFGKRKEEFKDPRIQAFAFNQFQRVLPLPKGTDPNRVTYQKLPGEILVTIPKNGTNPKPLNPQSPTDNKKPPMVI